MNYISPSVLNEFIICPRAFQFRKIHNLSLVPSTSSLFTIQAQKRIEGLTRIYFSILNSSWNTKTPSSLKDLEFLLNLNYSTYFDQGYPSDHLDRILCEKVFAFLSWLIKHLWKRGNEYDLIPVRVNEIIQAPELRMIGKPSLIFQNSEREAFIVIQSFKNQNEISSTLKEKMIIYQALIYAQILRTMNFEPKEFIHIDYHSMSLIQREISSTDFSELNIFLKEVKASIKYGEFNLKDSPPCKGCEFDILCNSGEI